MISVIVASYGAESYRELSHRAHASAFLAVSAVAPWGEVIRDHDPDGTLAVIRNELAGRATGDWLCFLDADDELHPDYLLEMEGAIRRCEIALSQFPPTSDPTPRKLLAPAVQYLDRGAPLGPARIPNAGLWPDTNECVIGTLVPRDLFLEVGGFRELPSLEDYDLWLRCVKAGARIVHVPDAVYVAHVNPLGGRNADQSVYERLREEHAEVFAR